MSEGPIELSPEAEAELAAAILWYDNQAEGLGSAFLAEIRASTLLLANMPGAGRAVGMASDGTPIRQYLIPRFPFSLVYLALQHGIHVLAVAHGRRWPGFWKGRIS